MNENRTPWYVWIMLAAIVGLVLVSFADHGVRVQSPIYVAPTATAITCSTCSAPAPTEAPKATEEPAEAAPTIVSTIPPTQVPAAQPADRVARLIELDKVYRAQGWMAWLKAAGVTCDAAVEARQPEEETLTDANGAHVVVSGIQVKGNCTIPWPAVVTTDRPDEVTTTASSRTYQPDLKNPSVMYTDVDLHGQGTIWVDASNWSQMDPTK